MPWRNPRRRSAIVSGDAVLRNPITGSGERGACAASGQAAAAPPRRVTNSRRLKLLNRMYLTSVRAPRYILLYIAEPGQWVCELVQAFRARDGVANAPANDRCWHTAGVTRCAGLSAAVQVFGRRQR